MPFKINIADKGKTFKVETDTEFLIGKKLGETIDGNEINSNLEGYELEIKGTADKAGFPGKQDVEGPALRRVLLTKGWGMKKHPKKEGKKARTKNMPKGLRLKKTVRGNTISKDTIQINLAVKKQGHKKLTEIFPEQARTKKEKETEKNQPKQENKQENKGE